MTSDREKNPKHFLMFQLQFPKPSGASVRSVEQRKEGVALSRCSLLTAWHFKKHERLLIAAGGGQASTSRRVRSHSWLNGRLRNSNSLPQSEK